MQDSALLHLLQKEKGKIKISIVEATLINIILKGSYYRTIWGHTCLQMRKKIPASLPGINYSLTFNTYVPIECVNSSEENNRYSTWIVWKQFIQC